MRSSKMPVAPALVVVSIQWNGEPLAMKVAQKGEEVRLGEGKDAMAPLPEEALGSCSLVIADAFDGPHVCVPEGKVASITSGNRMRLVVGPCRERLSEGEEASVLFGAFEVTVGSHSRDRGKSRTKMAAGAWVHIATVAAIHAGLLFAGSRAALASSIEEGGTVDTEAMAGYLAAAEERSASKDERFQDNIGKQDEKRANGRDGDGKSGGGEKHSGEAGKAGAETSRAKGKGGEHKRRLTRQRCFPVRTIWNWRGRSGWWGCWQPKTRRRFANNKTAPHGDKTIRSPQLVECWGILSEKPREWVGFRCQELARAAVEKGTVLDWERLVRLDTPMAPLGPGRVALGQRCWGLGSEPLLGILGTIGVETKGCG